MALKGSFMADTVSCPAAACPAAAARDVGCAIHQPSGQAAAGQETVSAIKERPQPHKMVCFHQCNSPMQLPKHFHSQATRTHDACAKAQKGSIKNTQHPCERLYLLRCLETLCSKVRNVCSQVRFTTRP